MACRYQKIFVSNGSKNKPRSVGNPGLQPSLSSLSSLSRSISHLFFRITGRIVESSCRVLSMLEKWTNVLLGFCWGYAPLESPAFKMGPAPIHGWTTRLRVGGGMGMSLNGGYSRIFWFLVFGCIWSRWKMRKKLRMWEWKKNTDETSIVISHIGISIVHDVLLHSGIASPERCFCRSLDFIVGRPLQHAHGRFGGQKQFVCFPWWRWTCLFECLLEQASDSSYIAHRIHVWYIFAYIYHIFVAKCR